MKSWERFMWITIGLSLWGGPNGLVAQEQRSSDPAFSIHCLFYSYSLDEMRQKQNCSWTSTWYISQMVLVLFIAINDTLKLIVLPSCPILSTYYINLVFFQFTWHIQIPYHLSSRFLYNHIFHSYLISARMPSELGWREH
jgi:hypothetical protein